MTRETIAKIVKASGVSAGELILIHFWGENADKTVANQFAAAVAALGASPVVLQQARSVNREIFAGAKESCFDERYFGPFSKFDAVLDVFACQPIVLGYELEDAQMELYRRYISQLFEKLVTCKRFAQIRIPTAANAAESGLDPQDYIRRMDRAYDVDYAAVRAACEHAAAQFAGASRVAARTGEGCVLQLELTGRTWLTDAGDGDLPCGEIYIAPVEAKTNGDVFFGTLYLEGEAYTDVTLQITNGEITGSSCEAVAAHFAGLPRENRIVCELGLGMNPNVTDLCGYTLLDEKMAGTFHIAVGANTMFGGENRATDHGDFVGRGEVEVLARGTTGYWRVKPE